MTPVERCDGDDDERGVRQRQQGIARIGTHAVSTPRLNGDIVSSSHRGVRICARARSAVGPATRGASGRSIRRASAPRSAPSSTLANATAAAAIGRMPDRYERIGGAWQRRAKVPIAMPR